MNRNPRNLFPTPAALATIASIALTTMLLSGCLTPRTQLREDGSPAEEARSAPNKVQEVREAGNYAIDELKSEITRLTGRIEDLERAQKQAPGGVTKEDLKKLETRIVELEQAQIQVLENLKKAQETQTVAVDPTALIDKARQQLEEGNSDAAIETLSVLLKNPKAKAGVEEATFLRAEAYFQSKQYKKAIVDYSRFPEKFTRSKHMPVALWKIGQSFEALGMKDDAQSFYQELLDKFPKSPEAKKLKIRHGKGH